MHDTTSMGCTLDHVAIATTNGVPLERFLERSLHARRDRGGEHRDEADAFCGGQWRLEGNGKVEVLAPLNGPESRMGKFLRKQPSRIHHVTFFVDDLALALERARDLGFEIAEGRPVAGWREAYLSPRQTFGLLFQLVDASSEYDAVGLRRHWTGFSGEAVADEIEGVRARSARIAGLRLAARDRAPAERLLRDCLGGIERELSFHWPGTTTAISVDIRDVEGPIAIEIDGAAPSGDGLFVSSATSRQLDAA